MTGWRSALAVGWSASWNSPLRWPRIVAVSLALLSVAVAGLCLTMTVLAYSLRAERDAARLPVASPELIVDMEPPSGDTMSPESYERARQARMKSASFVLHGLFDALPDGRQFSVVLLRPNTEPGPQYPQLRVTWV